jgi:hypothetical protein
MFLGVLSCSVLMSKPIYSGRSFKAEVTLNLVPWGMNGTFVAWVQSPAAVAQWLVKVPDADPWHMHGFHIKLRSRSHLPMWLQFIHPLNTGCKSFCC